MKYTHIKSQNVKYIRLLSIRGVSYSVRVPTSSYDLLQEESIHATLFNPSKGRQECH
jgi:hypothetical protein